MRSAAVTCHDGYDIEPYRAALRDAGVEPVVVTPFHGLNSLDSLAGLVIAGGTDLSPALYGQTPHPRTQQPRPDRDALEQRLLREALARDLPVLAICRGMQLFNVTHPGGTLLQDIEGHRTLTPDKAEPAHDVRVGGGTLLHRILGAGPCPVNSRHHQAIDTVGAGLVVSARAADGVVEALERPDRRFAVAVQWHPENQIHRFPEQKNLFLALSDALR